MQTNWKSLGATRYAIICDGAATQGIFMEEMIVYLSPTIKL